MRFLILVSHFTLQKQYCKSVVGCQKVTHKSVVVCQKVPHKSVVVCQKVAHKSVVICQKVPHKSVNCFAISLFFQYICGKYRMAYGKIYYARPNCLEK